MSHDRGCFCGRERWEYDSCPKDGCIKKPRLVFKPHFKLKLNGERVLKSILRYVKYPEI